MTRAEAATSTRMRDHARALVNTEVFCHSSREGKLARVQKQNAGTA
ncbi:hypothetical protein [Bradyrhizobium sp. USDA 10063]